MAFAARELRGLGYEFVAGPSGAPSDLVLRQKEDLQKGFEWKGQGNYDAVGDAVVLYVQSQLSLLCGLMPLPLPRRSAACHSVVYATEDLCDESAPRDKPVLLLICGSAPGGAAGVWGRSICINEGLHAGAMFDYILRAKSLGWSVVVANPNANDANGMPLTGSESPHVHLQTLWKDYFDAWRPSCVLVVAHSYGAPNVVHLLKAEEAARACIKAVAFTDGGAFAGSLLQERVPADGEGSPALVEKMREFAELAPAAFAPAAPEVLKILGAVGRNFVASQLPAGTPIAADRGGVLAVSAGHESHPATTHAAADKVFDFLCTGPEGKAEEANAEVRATLS